MSKTNSSQEVSHRPGSRPAPFYLKLEEEEGPSRLFTIEGSEALVGRSAQCNICLSDPYVSRSHLKIYRQNEGFLLDDLRSTHGTFVNGRKVSQCHLQPGDRIKLGLARMQLIFLGEDPDATFSRTSLPTDEFQESISNLTSVFQAPQSFSNLEKISCILDFQYNWSQRFSPEKTFQQILTSALRISGAERGFVLLREAEDFNYVVGMNGDGDTLPEKEFQTSQSVVRQVAAEAKPVFMTQQIDGNFAQKESIIAMRLRAIACLPLSWISSDSAEPQVRGILYLDSTNTMQALTGLDQKILNKLALEATNVFEKLEMIETLQARRLIEGELSLARETQEALLPREIPTFKGYRVAAFNQPTRYVSGDLFDFLNADSGIPTGVLADVSGKGVSAALLSSLLVGALESQFRAGVELETAVTRVNRLLLDKTQVNRFVTLFLFSFDSEGKGRYLSAGHNPAFVYRKRSGTVEPLPSQNIVLGVLAPDAFASDGIELEAGDILLVYSDGLTEAVNSRDEFFGEDRLAEVFQQAGVEGIEHVREQIFAELEDFIEDVTQPDDITLILLQRSD